MDQNQKGIKSRGEFFPHARHRFQCLLIRRFRDNGINHTVEWLEDGHVVRFTFYPLLKEQWVAFKHKIACADLEEHGLDYQCIIAIEIAINQFVDLENRWIYKIGREKWGKNGTCEPITLRLDGRKLGTRPCPESQYKPGGGFKRYREPNWEDLRAMAEEEVKPNGFREAKKPQYQEEEYIPFYREKD